IPAYRSRRARHRCRDRLLRTLAARQPAARQPLSFSAVRNARRFAHRRVGRALPELKDKRVRGRLEGRRVVPYWPRADIEAGRAPLAGKELVWVDDAVEAFFLQIQGSGRVQLAEGGVLRLGYADQNGQPFRSIGRLLVERGELPLA